MKKVISVWLSILVVTASTIACSSEADVASFNVSKAADQFEVTRRIVFFNGITGQYLLTIEGLCSLGNNDPVQRLSVTCKVSPTEYKKHFLGLSDNVSYFAEQIEPVQASPFHYRVVINPSTIIPDLDVR